MGWKTCSNARVDGLVEDVATSTLDEKLGGVVGEGVYWSGRSCDLQQ